MKHKTDPYGAWQERSWKSHVRSGFDVRVEPSQLKELARNTTHCGICDCVLDWKGDRSNSNDKRPTLDRINNENLIAIDNIQIICRKCNRTKSDRTMSEFIDYCKSVTSRFKIQ
jgi:5-methylcytosine-specific restriction endonuclease McrA